MSAIYNLSKLYSVLNRLYNGPYQDSVANKLIENNLFVIKKNKKRTENKRKKLSPVH